MARLNKKILCFVDECGTAGEADFALGCVIVWARDCGRADKALSDLLEPNASELHAVDLRNAYLQGLLGRFAQTDKPEGLVLINKSGVPFEGSCAEIYALNVIEAVKTGIGQFRKQNNWHGKIGNIDLVLDLNHQNADPAFDVLLEKARISDGRFRAVNHVGRIDSAASRMLQLADVVAYARKWVQNGEKNAAGLRNSFGIRVL